MVTIGSQASGLIGRITWTSGLIAALNRFDMPATRPSGTATSEARTKPIATVLSEVKIWSMKVGRVAADLHRRRGRGHRLGVRVLPRAAARIRLHQAR